MRKIKYLSPSSIACATKDLETFYLRYLAENRPPREPQTQAMSVGAAFDAYAKNYLATSLFGNEGKDKLHWIKEGDQEGPEFNLELLLLSQVEPQNREFAREAGKKVFKDYQKSGALADLLTEIRSGYEPKMETTIVAKIGDVTFLGKPDLYFVSSEGHNVIYDFKVNGYCSKYGASPRKGYILMRGEGRGCNRAHKDAHLHKSRGLMVNLAHKLEEVDSSWAAQLAIYAWSVGESVGGRFVAGIEQIVYRKQKCRVAHHRCFIGEEFQNAIFDQATYLWDLCKSDHIFRDMSKEESQARCKTLDRVYEAYKDVDPIERLF